MSSIEKQNNVLNVILLCVIVDLSYKFKLNTQKQECIV